LRIDESELKDYTGFKKIPSDLKEARKKFLDNVVGNKNDKK